MCVCVCVFVCVCVCVHVYRTDEIDAVGQWSGSEGTGVLGQAPVEQVDDVAVPAPLKPNNNNK